MAGYEQRELAVGFQSLVDHFVHPAVRPSVEQGRSGEQGHGLQARRHVGGRSAGAVAADGREGAVLDRSGGHRRETPTVETLLFSVPPPPPVHPCKTAQQAAPEVYCSKIAYQSFEEVKGRQSQGEQDSLQCQRYNKHKHAGTHVARRRTPWRSGKRHADSYHQVGVDFRPVRGAEQLQSGLRYRREHGRW